MHRIDGTLARTALVLAIAFAQGACGDPLETYPLLGQRYDVAGDCLNEQEVIDVIEGVTDPECETILCLRSQETGDFFVVEACETPPLYDDQTTADDGPCAMALIRFGQGDAGLCHD